MKPLQILTLFALGLALGLSASQASAQDPYAAYNTDRAYRHFLTSPYSFRTYSAPDSVRVWGYDTPLESGRFYRTTGSYYEEISPYGRWSSGIPARTEGYVTRRPIVVYPQVVVPRYPYPYPFPP
jgi:hypothetical protein